ncbi:hypothetical protein ACJJTC_008106 [Scirpophaga incertulas]
MAALKLSSDQVPEKFTEWLLALGCPPDKVPSLDKITEMCKGEYHYVWRNMIERIEGTETIRRKRLQVFCADMMKWNGKKVLNKPNSKGVMPDELALWNRESELTNKVANTENKIENIQHDIKKLTDAVSTKLLQRNTARQNLQNKQRRLLLVHEIAEELKYKRKKLEETKSIAKSLCLNNKIVDVEEKLDKYVATSCQINFEPVAGPTSNSLLKANPVSSSSVMSTNGDICDAEEYISCLAKCCGDSLWPHLYARRARLVNNLTNESQHSNDVSENLTTPQTILTYTAGMHCSLALKAIKNRVLVKQTLKKLAVDVNDLDKLLSAEELETIVLKCENASATARVNALRSLLTEMTSHTGAFLAGPDNIVDNNCSGCKHIPTIDMEIVSKKDELKRLITLLATMEKKLHNARDCLLSMFNKFVKDLPMQDIDRYREFSQVSIMNLRQFYEGKRKAGMNKLQLRCDSDFSVNDSYNKLPDAPTFVDELEMYLERINLENNRKLVLGNGQNIWIFETMQAAATRLLSASQDMNLTSNLLCPAISLSYNMKTLITSVQNKHWFQHFLDKIKGNCNKLTITYDLKEQEYIITDKIKKQLHENIINLQKINKELDLDYAHLKFWSDNEMKKYISEKRRVNGKSYQEYEFCYKDHIVIII